MNIKSETAIFCACIALAVLQTSQAGAFLINFETTTSGSTPTDDATLDSSFIDGTTIITFGYDTTDDLAIDTFAFFEIRGAGGPDLVNAYKTAPNNLGPIDGDNTLDEEGGNWFLRAPGNYGSDVDIKGGDDFLIVYTGTLPRSASGQIWDIDGTSGGLFERWRVEALDSSGAIISSQDSPFFYSKDNPPFDSLDGWPWTFSFNDLPSPIKTIRISWIGEIGSYDAGFAFDNFNATAGIPSAVDSRAPKVFRLERNYPNPFSSYTRLSFSVDFPARVVLGVYDSRGRLVRSLLNELVEGTRTVFWDGRNTNGELVPSGIYFYRLRSNTASASRKMLLLR